ncbi:MAG TPA: nucleoside deaminase, partial [Acidimicrobiales bacterium]|nr:nucleoside deaminase [Acidimicrobiales bacterium]
MNRLAAMPDVPLDETSDPESPSPERSFFRPRDVDPQLRPAELAAMSVALDEALLAEAHGDIPVGAVLLSPSRPGDEPEILSRRHNERELTGDPTAHAEMLVLREAAAAAGTWRLEDCTLVVTLEPCPMCA